MSIEVLWAFIACFCVMLLVLIFFAVLYWKQILRNEVLIDRIMARTYQEFMDNRARVEVIKRTAIIDPAKETGNIAGEYEDELNEGEKL